MHFEILVQGCKHEVIGVENARLADHERIFECMGLYDAMGVEQLLQKKNLKVMIELLKFIAA